MARGVGEGIEAGARERVITPTEALYLYSSNDHKWINAHLRGRLDPRANVDVKQIEKRIDMLDALTRNPNPDSPQAIWRGGRRLTNWDDPGFLSCTVDRQAAEDFVSRNPHRVLYKIILPENAPGVDVAKTLGPLADQTLLDEAEYLLPRAAKFEYINESEDFILLRYLP